MKKKTIYQIIEIVSVLLVAGLGSLFVNLGMGWFDALKKPTQWIPNFVIPVVWSIIYLLAAIYLFIEIKNDRLGKEEMWWFVANGVLNILWCLVFFTLNQTLLGLVFIVLNLVAGWILFVKISKKQNWLSRILIIYPIWLSIATSLNLCLWILN